MARANGHVSAATWSGAGSAQIWLLVAATAPSLVHAAPAEKPVAGQQVRFPKGYWSALPQVGPDGKVRQCVLVALRQRAGSRRRCRYALCAEHRPRRRPCRSRSMTTACRPSRCSTTRPRCCSMIAHSPRSAFRSAPRSCSIPAMPPARSPRSARRRASGCARRAPASIPARSTIGLPAEALNWLKQCGTAFDIAIDRPTDPDAPEHAGAAAALRRKRVPAGEAGGTAGHGRQAEDRGLGCLRAARQRGPHHRLLHPPPLRDRLGTWLTHGSAPSSW